MRYALGGWVQTLTASFFPWGTLAVNVLGCFAIGVLATLLEERSAIGPSTRWFLLVGLLGGFTTFSTFGFETWRLVEAGDWSRAAGNVLGSTGAGLAAVAGGVALARAVA